jgi:hypothetical protein
VADKACSVSGQWVGLESVTIEEGVMAKKTALLDPIHPGEMLLEEFMKPLGISINKLARELRAPPNRISAIVNGRRGASAALVFLQ